MKVAVLAALAVTVWCGSAEAALPGANGRIVFTQNLAPILGVWFPEHQGVFLCGVSPDGSRFQRLTPVPPDAAWAPDGRIAYSDESGIVVASPTGEAPRTIAAGSQPSWSPDGKQIVFVASRRRGGPVLAVVSGDGSGLRLLPSAARGVTAPAWSPDGDEIAFVGFAGGDADGGSLHLLSLDGSRERVLGPPGAYSAVEWSPDGTRLLLADDAGGTWLIDSSDGSRRFLSAGRATWSPDGTQVAIFNGPVFVIAQADGTHGRVVSYVPDTWDAAPRWLSQAQDRSAWSGSCDTSIYQDGPVDGTNGPDTFFVGPASVQLSTFAGDDQIYATNPAHDLQTDSFDTGSGNDVVSVVEGRGLIELGPGDDSFDASGGLTWATQSSHVVYGGSGDDSLRGGPASDRLYGGAGRDTIVAGPDRDTIVGGAGSDRILARDGSVDRIDCGGGRDVVYSDRLDRWTSSCERVLAR